MKRCKSATKSIVLDFTTAKSLVLRRANKPTPKLTSASLFDFSDKITPESLLASAQFLQRELPIRIAQRLADFYKLPYILGCNPHLKEVYDLYGQAFIEMINMKPIVTHEDEAVYTKHLSSYLDDHQNVVTLLANGTKESARYVDVDRSQLAGFLDRTIQSRIGLRILIENQIALAQQSKKNREERSGHVGIITRNLKPSKVINKMVQITSEMCLGRYAVAPEVVLRGDIDAEFAYIGPHLEYILQELLKNAMRATVEFHGNAPDVILPPVVITLVRYGRDFTLKIADEGGGMTLHQLEKCWQWSYTTVDKTSGKVDLSRAAGGNMLGALGDTEIHGPLAGYGFGLPMARTYATYFSGSLDIMPIHGYGTDVILRLQSLDSADDEMK